MIIGLHGLPRSGKDSIAQILRTHTPDYVRIAFADSLKCAAAELLNRPLSECNGENGFDREAVMPEWGFSMRWFLKVLGTECLRQQVDTDFWVKRVRLKIREALDFGCSIVVTDVRFENEAQMVRDMGGVIVEVVRPGTNGSDHPSDQPVKCDYQIVNDTSLEDLKHTTLSFVGYLVKRAPIASERQPSILDLPPPAGADGLAKALHRAARAPSSAPLPPGDSRQPSCPAPQAAHEDGQSRLSSRPWLKAPPPFGR